MGIIVMINNYEREVLHNLERELEVDDPQFIELFRARKNPSDLLQRAHPVVALLAATGLVVTMAIIVSYPISALPVITLAVCAWLLRKLRGSPHRRDEETQPTSRSK
jgi:hypothetical protein